MLDFEIDGGEYKDYSSANDGKEADASIEG